ncbi:MAG: hypothetical protein RLZZ244_3127, partial [Verrucomicrobiota bacterium]
MIGWLAVSSEAFRAVRKLPILRENGGADKTPCALAWGFEMENRGDGPYRAGLWLPHRFNLNRGGSR